MRNMAVQMTEEQLQQLITALTARGGGIKAVRAAAVVGPWLGKGKLRAVPGRR